MEYPAPKSRRHWKVQVEFHDGTTIDAASDEDALERWRRIAAWSDPTAETDPTDWMTRILARSRVFYVTPLTGITPESTATEILEALANGNCLSLRRK
jgi:hypothetical protein